MTLLAPCKPVQTPNAPQGFMGRLGADRRSWGILGRSGGIMERWTNDT